MLICQFSVMVTKAKRSFHQQLHSNDAATGLLPPLSVLRSVEGGRGVIGFAQVPEKGFLLCLTLHHLQ